MENPLKNKVYSLIKRDLKTYDGKIVLLKGQYCGGSDRCYGMFEFDSNDNPVIKVAVGEKSNEEWFGVLLHEYCHFEQWKVRSKVWKEFEESNFSIEDILKNPRKHKKEILILIKLEADCERRVVQMLRKHDLFCAKRYAKEANAVLFKYGFLYTDNYWPKNNPELNNVWEDCPDRILRSYLSYLNIPENVYDTYINSRP